MRGEIQSIKQEVSALDSRIAVVEQEQGAMSQAVQAEINDQLIQLQLLLDDLENRSCRQNIRL